jgi:hypothetical protein
MNQITSILFTLEELAALSQATATLNSLLQKIQTNAPDAWAAVSGDFKSSADAWARAFGAATAPMAETVNAIAAAGGGATYGDASTDGHIQATSSPVTPAPIIPPDVAAVVNASGVTTHTPTDSSGNA